MGGVGPPAGPLFILSETRCCGRSLVSPTRETCVLGPAGSSLGGWGAARGPGLGAVRELTWAAQAGAVGDSRDAEAVAGGEAAAVQDGRPGVAVAGHDGRTAGLHGLTQAAARVDDPAGGGGRMEGTGRGGNQDPASWAPGWAPLHSSPAPIPPPPAPRSSQYRAQRGTARLLGNDTWSPSNGSQPGVPGLRLTAPTVLTWPGLLSSFPAHLPLQLGRTSSAAERGVYKGPCTLGLHSPSWREKAGPSLLS